MIYDELEWFDPAYFDMPMICRVFGQLDLATLHVHRGFVLPVINMADKTAAHGVNDVYTN